MATYVHDNNDVLSYLDHTTCAQLLYTDSSGTVTSNDNQMTFLDNNDTINDSLNDSPLMADRITARPSAVPSSLNLSRGPSLTPPM